MSKTFMGLAVGIGLGFALGGISLHARNVCEDPTSSGGQINSSRELLEQVSEEPQPNIAASVEAQPSNADSQPALAELPKGHEIVEAFLQFQIDSARAAKMELTREQIDAANKVADRLRGIQQRIGFENFNFAIQLLSLLEHWNVEKYKSATKHEEILGLKISDVPELQSILGDWIKTYPADMSLRDLVFDHLIDPNDVGALNHHVRIEDALKRYNKLLRFSLNPEAATEYFKRQAEDPSKEGAAPPTTLTEILALADADKAVSALADELKTSDLDADLLKMILMSEAFGSPISDKAFKVPQLTEKLAKLPQQFSSDEDLKMRVGRMTRFLKFWKELTVDQVQGNSPQDVEARERLKSGLELIILQNYAASEKDRIPKAELEKMVGLIDQLDAKLKDVDFAALKISKAEVWSILLASAFADAKKQEQEKQTNQSKKSKKSKKIKKPNENLETSPDPNLPIELQVSTIDDMPNPEEDKEPSPFAVWIKSLEKANEDLKDFSSAEEISELLKATSNIKKWMGSEEEYALFLDAWKDKSLSELKALMAEVKKLDERITEARKERLFHELIELPDEEVRNLLVSTALQESVQKKEHEKLSKMSLKDWTARLQAVNAGFEREFNDLIFKKFTESDEASDYRDGALLGGRSPMSQSQMLADRQKEAYRIAKLPAPKDFNWQDHIRALEKSNRLSRWIKDSPKDLKAYDYALNQFVQEAMSTDPDVRQALEDANKALGPRQIDFSGGLTQSEESFYDVHRRISDAYDTEGLASLSYILQRIPALPLLVTAEQVQEIDRKIQAGASLKEIAELLKSGDIQVTGGLDLTFGGLGAGQSLEAGARKIEELPAWIQALVQRTGKSTMQGLPKSLLNLIALDLQKFEEGARPFLDGQVPTFRRLSDFSSESAEILARAQRLQRSVDGYPILSILHSDIGREQVGTYWSRLMDLPQDGKAVKLSFHDLMNLNYEFDPASKEWKPKTPYRDGSINNALQVAHFLNEGLKLAEERVEQARESLAKNLSSSGKFDVEFAKGFSVPELRALVYLKDRFGWDHQVFYQKDLTTISLKEFVNRRSKGSPRDRAELLMVAQQLAIREGILEYLYGPNWSEVLGYDKMPEDRKAQGIYLAYDHYIEPVLTELSLNQQKAKEDFAMISMQEEFVFPSVRWAKDRYDSLIRRLMLLKVIPEDWEKATVVKDGQETNPHLEKVRELLIDTAKRFVIPFKAEVAERQQKEQDLFNTPLQKKARELEMSLIMSRRNPTTEESQMLQDARNQFARLRMQNPVKPKERSLNAQTQIDMREKVQERSQTYDQMFPDQKDLEKSDFSRVGRPDLRPTGNSVRWQEAAPGEKAYYVYHSEGAVLSGARIGEARSVPYHRAAYHLFSGTETDKEFLEPIFDERANENLDSLEKVLTALRVPKAKAIISKISGGAHYENGKWVDDFKTLREFASKVAYRVRLSGAQVYRDAKDPEALNIEMVRKVYLEAFLDEEVEELLLGEVSLQGRSVYDEKNLKEADLTKLANLLATKGYKDLQTKLADPKVDKDKIISQLGNLRNLLWSLKILYGTDDVPGLIANLQILDSTNLMRHMASRFTVGSLAPQKQEILKKRLSAMPQLLMMPGFAAEVDVNAVSSAFATFDGVSAGDKTFSIDGALSDLQGYFGSFVEGVWGRTASQVWPEKGPITLLAKMPKVLSEDAQVKKFYEAMEKHYQRLRSIELGLAEGSTPASRPKRVGQALTWLSGDEYWIEVQYDNPALPRTKLKDDPKRAKKMAEAFGSLKLDLSYEQFKGILNDEDIMPTTIESRLKGLKDLLIQGGVLTAEASDKWDLSKSAQNLMKLHTKGVIDLDQLFDRSKSVFRAQSERAYHSADKQSDVMGLFRSTFEDDIELSLEFEDFLKKQFGRNFDSEPQSLEAARSALDEFIAQKIQDKDKAEKFKPIREKALAALEEFAKMNLDLHVRVNRDNFLIQTRLVQNELNADPALKKFFVEFLPERSSFDSFLATPFVSRQAGPLYAKAFDSIEAEVDQIKGMKMMAASGPMISALIDDYYKDEPSGFGKEASDPFNIIPLDVMNGNKAKKEAYLSSMTKNRLDAVFKNVWGDGNAAILREDTREIVRQRFLDAFGKTGGDFAYRFLNKQNGGEGLAEMHKAAAKIGSAMREVEFELAQAHQGYGREDFQKISRSLLDYISEAATKEPGIAEGFLKAIEKREFTSEKIRELFKELKISIPEGMLDETLQRQFELAASVARSITEFSSVTQNFVLGMANQNQQRMVETAMVPKLQKFFEAVDRYPMGIHATLDGLDKHFATKLGMQTAVFSSVMSQMKHAWTDHAGEVATSVGHFVGGAFKYLFALPVYRAYEAGNLIRGYYIDNLLLGDGGEKLERYTANLGKWGPEASAEDKEWAKSWSAVTEEKLLSAPRARKIFGVDHLGDIDFTLGYSEIEFAVDLGSIFAAGKGLKPVRIAGMTAEASKGSRLLGAMYSLGRWQPKSRLGKFLTREWTYGQLGVHKIPGMSWAKERTVRLFPKPASFADEIGRVEMQGFQMGARAAQEEAAQGLKAIQRSSTAFERAGQGSLASRARQGVARSWDAARRRSTDIYDTIRAAPTMATGGRVVRELARDGFNVLKRNELLKTTSRLLLEGGGLTVVPYFLQKSILPESLGATPEEQNANFWKMMVQSIGFLMAMRQLHTPWMPTFVKNPMVLNAWAQSNRVMGFTGFYYIFRDLEMNAAKSAVILYKEKTGQTSYSDNDRDEQGRLIFETRAEYDEYMANQEPYLTAANQLFIYAFMRATPHIYKPFEKMPLQGGVGGPLKWLYGQPLQAEFAGRDSFRQMVKQIATTNGPRAVEEMARVTLGLDASGKPVAPNLLLEAYKVQGASLSKEGKADAVKMFLDDIQAGLRMAEEAKIKTLRDFEIERRAAMGKGVDEVNAGYEALGKLASELPTASLMDLQATQAKAVADLADATPATPQPMGIVRYNERVSKLNWRENPTRLVELLQELKLNLRLENNQNWESQFFTEVGRRLEARDRGADVDPEVMGIRIVDRFFSAADFAEFKKAWERAEVTVDVKYKPLRGAEMDANLTQSNLPVSRTDQGFFIFNRDYVPANRRATMSAEAEIKGTTKVLPSDTATRILVADLATSSAGQPLALRLRESGPLERMLVESHGLGLRFAFNRQGNQSARERILETGEMIFDVKLPKPLELEGPKEVAAEPASPGNGVKSLKVTKSSGGYDLILESSGGASRKFSNLNQSDLAKVFEGFGIYVESATSQSTQSALARASGPAPETYIYVDAKTGEEISTTTWFKGQREAENSAVRLETNQYAGDVTEYVIKVTDADGSTKEFKAPIHEPSVLASGLQVTVNPEFGSISIPSRTLPGVREVFIPGRELSRPTEAELRTGKEGIQQHRSAGLWVHVIDLPGLKPVETLTAAELAKDPRVITVERMDENFYLSFDLLNQATPTTLGDLKIAQYMSEGDLAMLDALRVRAAAYRILETPEQKAIYRMQPTKEKRLEFLKKAIADIEGRAKTSKEAEAEVQEAKKMLQMIEDIYNRKPAEVRSKAEAAGSAKETKTWEDICKDLEVDPKDENIEKMGKSDFIKGAYRRAAMKYHPDRNPGDPIAAQKFTAAAAAWEYFGKYLSSP